MRFRERLKGNEVGPTRWYASNPTALDQLQSIGRRIDSGIEQISIDNSLGDPRLKLRHSGLDQVIELQLESCGTRQFIKLFPFIQMALERGSVAVVDDIDSAIHPLLLLEIIRWFVDEKKNPFGARLWMACHAATLLTESTKEEVLFCEKDSQGRTKVFGLADIEGVRHGENFLGKYLSGEYGAAPILG
ncbi:MAG: AAA family ATPase [Albidovulum sp.]|nr:AAA family ATPase [Albidovulum sp.]